MISYAISLMEPPGILRILVFFKFLRGSTSDSTVGEIKLISSVIPPAEFVLVLFYNFI